MIEYTEIKTKERFQELFKNVDISEIVNEINPVYMNHESLLLDHQVEPSDVYKDIISRIREYCNRYSILTTKLYIDNIILDVLHKRKSRNNSEKLKYSGLNNDINVFLLINSIELLSDFNPYRLLSVMAYYKDIHKEIFGILSDSDRWVFYKIDENLKVWRSIDYFLKRNKKDIWKFIDYIIDKSDNFTNIISIN